MRFTLATPTLFIALLQLGASTLAAPFPHNADGANSLLRRDDFESPGTLVRRTGIVLTEGMEFNDIRTKANVPWSLMPDSMDHNFKQGLEVSGIFQLKDIYSICQGRCHQPKGVCTTI